MGRTPKPLAIVVTPPLHTWKEIQALEDQGHTVMLDEEWSWLEGQPDVILGPNCWRMDEEHRQYLDLAIKEARKVKYPKGGKDDPTD